MNWLDGRDEEWKPVIGGLVVGALIFVAFIAVALIWSNYP